MTKSFNGLLSRMAALDHSPILATGRKILRNAKRQRVDPTMILSEVMQMTGLQNEDVETFVSCRLIAVTESADDVVVSFRDVFCLIKIFSRFIAQGVIPERST